MGTAHSCCAQKFVVRAKIRSKFQLARAQKNARAWRESCPDQVSATARQQGSGMMAATSTIDTQPYAFTFDREHRALLTAWRAAGRSPKPPTDFIDV
jgi:hypothetical protein